MICDYGYRKYAVFDVHDARTVSNQDLEDLSEQEYIYEQKNKLRYY